MHNVMFARYFRDKAELEDSTSIQSGHGRSRLTGRVSLSGHLVLLFIFLIFIPTITSGFAGGTGAPNDPYQIATAEQLLSIGSDPNLLNKSLILIDDIDLDPNLPGGQVFDQAVIAPDLNDVDPDFQGMAFNGSLDGHNYSIKNLHINSDSEYAGLFGLIGSLGIVRNLEIRDASVSGNASGHGFRGRCGTGALAGESRGKILSCVSSGIINGNYDVGGLVGHNETGTIIDCTTSGEVNGTSSVGGLVGYSQDGTIRHCGTTCTISAENAPVDWSAGSRIAIFMPVLPKTLFLETFL